MKYRKYAGLIFCNIIVSSCKNTNVEKLKNIAVNDHITKVQDLLGTPVKSAVELSPVNGCSGETIVLTYKSAVGYSDNIHIYLSESDSTVCYISDGAN